MIDELITLLETFEYQVIRQGSMSQDAIYPDTFFTFLENEELGHSYYDNDEVSATYDYDVNVYSNDPDLCYSLLDDARELLKDNGWTITQRGTDVPSDEITHIGRGMTVVKLN